MVRLARSGLDLIISWCFHLQGKIDWESSERVQGELGDIRVSVPLGPWHLFVIVTQPLLDPASVPLQDRSGILPQMWTWGQPLSRQQLCSVSSCLPHKFRLQRGVRASTAAQWRMHTQLATVTHNLTKCFVKCLTWNRDPSALQNDTSGASFPVSGETRLGLHYTWVELIHSISYIANHDGGRLWI